MKTFRVVLGYLTITFLVLFLLAAMTVKLPDNHVPNTDWRGNIILVWLVFAFLTGAAMSVGEYKPILNIVASVAYGLTIWWTYVTPDGSDLILPFFVKVIGITAVYVVPAIHFFDLLLGYYQKEPEDIETNFDS